MTVWNISMGTSMVAAHNVSCTSRPSGCPVGVLIASPVTPPGGLILIFIFALQGPLSAKQPHHQGICCNASAHVTTSCHHLQLLAVQSWVCALP